MTKDISESELVILDALWKQSPMRSGEIAATLESRKNWHQRTVNTLVRRLVEKEALGYDKAPGGFLYYPLIRREDFRQERATKLVKELFDGEVSPLIAAFAEHEDLSPNDLEELRNLVSRLSK